MFGGKRSLGDACAKSRLRLHKFAFARCAVGWLRDSSHALLLEAGGGYKGWTVARMLT